MTATAGNAFAGQLAASLQAVEIYKLVTGDLEHVAAGHEVVLDARLNRHVVSRLVRNPDCRFSHQQWTIRWTEDLSLEAALAWAGGSPEKSRLVVPESAFVSQLVCPHCGLAETLWRVRESIDAAVLRCPCCGTARPVRGFDLCEQLAVADLPAELRRRPLAERGLRLGEVFAVEAPGQTARHFALGEPVCAGRGAGGPPLVVAGQGNIGSWLAPLLARMPGVARVTFCDPDVYEAGQLGQDFEPRAVGRPKAEVQADRLRALRPGLDVQAFTAPAEQLPLGALCGAIVVSCLDSRVARLRLAARAWHVGSPFVDAAVGGGESLLVRTSVFVPADDAPCFECAFDAEEYAALEQVYPCHNQAP